MSDILKTKGKLKIIRDNIVDENATHTMTSKSKSSVQLIVFKKHHFLLFFTFFIYSLSLIHIRCTPLMALFS